MKFKFDNDIEKAKVQYKSFAKVTHPDLGGNEDDFKQLQNDWNEYLKNSGHTDELSKILNEILSLDLEIDLVGSWLWIGGNTKPVKETLKTLGFKWASKKKLWFWHEGEFKKRSKKELSIGQIKSLHGSKNLKTKKRIA